MFERARAGERALLIQTWSGGWRDPVVLEEFGELARSAGATVVGTLSARIDQINPATLIGRGKVQEAHDLCLSLEADLVLVNHLLSPVQERNLERILECRVVDRTGLILDIFAQRARSHEGKLQVELAQLRHLSTRLVRGWTHLERQAGGSIGLRGPGETQLETDRRLLARRVDALEARLEKVDVQREQMRRRRLRNAVSRVALVGYTNAGKSTLFNALTGAQAYQADQLFATLDPTVRRLEGLPCGEVVLADTVGFVRDLPHDLVAAFRATLSETRDADLLLHVMDAADPLREEHRAQVDEVLEQVGADDLPQLLVFNKIDLLQETQPHVLPLGPEAEPATAQVWVSARTGAGLEALLETVSATLSGQRLQADLRISHAGGRLRARLFEAGVIRKEAADESGWLLQVDLPRALAWQLLAGEDPDSRAARRQLFAEDSEDSLQ